MGLTANQVDIINIVTKTSAACGFAGVLSMLYVIYRSYPTFRNPTGHIILAITFADLMDCVTKFVGRWGPESGLSSFICQWQAWSIQQFNFSSIFLIMLLGFNAVYLIYFKGDVEVIQKYEKYMIIGAFVVPIPFALYPVLNTPNLVGDVSTWCWISSAHPDYQISLWFGELWAVFLVNICILIMTYIGIRQQKIQLRENLSPLSKKMAKEDKAAKINKNGRSFGSFVILRMVAYLIAFMVTWIPSSLNRISAMELGYTVYALAVLQALVSPQRGLINALVYHYTWYQSPSASRDRQLSKDNSSTGSKEILNSGEYAMSKSKSSQSIQYQSRDTLNGIKSTRRASADAGGGSSSNMLANGGGKARRPSLQDQELEDLMNDDKEPVKAKGKGKEEETGNSEEKVNSRMVLSQESIAESPEGGNENLF